MDDLVLPPGFAILGESDAIELLGDAGAVPLTETELENEWTFVRHAPSDLAPGSYRIVQDGQERQVTVEDTELGALDIHMAGSAESSNVKLSHGTDGSCAPIDEYEDAILALEIEVPAATADGEFLRIVDPDGYEAQVFRVGKDAATVAATVNAGKASELDEACATVTYYDALFVAHDSIELCDDVSASCATLPARTTWSLVLGAFGLAVARRRRVCRR